MTTHSALLPGSTVNLFTVEHATSLLTTHLGLEDDIRSEGTNDNCKGKDNAEAFISDADFALRIQAEDLVNAVQIVEDAQFARELEEGFQANHLYLVMNPPSAAHRREIALSLLKRSGLSTLSDGQQIKASTSSVSLGSRLRTSTCEADPDTSQNVERYVEIDIAVIIDRTRIVHLGIDVWYVTTSSVMTNLSSRRHATITIAENALPVWSVHAPLTRSYILQSVATYLFPTTRPCHSSAILYDRITSQSSANSLSQLRNVSTAQSPIAQLLLPLQRA